MGLTNIKAPNGLSINGNAIREDIITTGKVFYVNSVTGSDGNKGDNPTKPLATIDKAIGLCTADKGDVIYVLPGHAETIASATSLVPDVDGISIIGLGNGTNAPQLTFSATASSIDISGAGTLIRNVHFIAGISAVVVGINVDADYVTLDNCKFTYGATAFDFVDFVDVDAVDFCTIVSCEFDAENATAGSNAAIRLDDTNNTRIVGNYFNGDFAEAAILGEGAAGASLLIKDNVIYNDDTGAASNGIDLNVAFTGLIIKNMVGSLYATAIDTLIDPGSCLNFENYACNAIDEMAAILPGTTSST